MQTGKTLGDGTEIYTKKFHVSKVQRWQRITVLGLLQTPYFYRIELNSIKSGANRVGDSNTEFICNELNRFKWAHGVTVSGVSKIVTFSSLFDKKWRTGEIGVFCLSIWHKLWVSTNRECEGWSDKKWWFFSYVFYTWIKSKSTTI